jgi:hypothetical protein
LAGEPEWLGQLAGLSSQQREIGADGGESGCVLDDMSATLDFCLRMDIRRLLSRQLLSNGTGAGASVSRSSASSTCRFY